MTRRPYQEKILSENIVTRKFSKHVKPNELVWHRDKENRIIEVLSGTGWKFQRDNELPIKINEGIKIYVKSGEYHRLIKGQDDLHVKIYKEGKKKKSKKSDGMRSVRSGADNNPKVTKMDFLPNKVLKKIADDKKISESSQKIICPNCGAHNDPDVEKCAKCGHSRKEGTWKKVNEESILESLLSEILDEKKRKRRRKRRRRRKVRKKATPGEKKYRREKYGATTKKRQSGFARAAYQYRLGNVKKAAAIRQRMEKQYMSEKLDREQLQEVIDEIIEFKKLKSMLEYIEDYENVEDLLHESLDEYESLDERRKRRRKRRKKGKRAGGLSAAVKKSLDKKADRRCLTRGSVYAEFRAGLAAFLSSGSRKGMSAHQWAHARVNSANPSKSWAKVKKRKKCPKKKRK